MDEHADEIDTLCAQWKLPPHTDTSVQSSCSFSPARERTGQRLRATVEETEDEEATPGLARIKSEPDNSELLWATEHHHRFQPLSKPCTVSSQKPISHTISPDQSAVAPLVTRRTVLDVKDQFHNCVASELIRRSEVRRIIQATANEQIRRQAWAEELSRQMDWAKSLLLAYPGQVALACGSLLDTLGPGISATV